MLHSVMKLRSGLCVIAYLGTYSGLCPSNVNDSDGETHIDEFIGLA